MFQKSIFIFLISFILTCTQALAYGIKYTKVTNSNGDKVIRAEIVNQDGHVVATGHSGTEGSRKQKKNEALEEAVDDLEENQG